jgi:hypothetical protein
MTRAKDLTPSVFGGDEWEAVKGATGPGWYAMDDNYTAVRGPFTTREECVKEIKREIKRASRT